MPADSFAVGRKKREDCWTKKEGGSPGRGSGIPAMDLMEDRL